MNYFTCIGKVDFVEPGEFINIPFEEKEILVYNLNGSLYATTSQCPGILDRLRIGAPAAAQEYGGLCEGEPDKMGVCKKSIDGCGTKSYEVKIEDGEILVAFT